MKILIVDDSMAMRRIVLRTLRQAGFEGHDFGEAANGKIALDMIRQSPPDLVLADWNMPEMSGIELLRAMREEGITVPLGFVTSESTEVMRSDAKSAGASFLVAKPFTPDDMKREVAQYIR